LICAEFNIFRVRDKRRHPSICKPEYQAADPDNCGQGALTIGPLAQRVARLLFALADYEGSHVCILESIQTDPGRVGVLIHHFINF